MQAFNIIVGWVEVTKPFGYAVPERSRRAGTAQQHHFCWISLFEALGQVRARSAKTKKPGFSYYFRDKYRNWAYSRFLNDNLIFILIFKNRSRVRHCPPIYFDIILGKIFIFISFNCSLVEEINKVVVGDADPTILYSQSPPLIRGI